MAVPPTASTLMPSSIGSLPSTIYDIDISASRYDIHSNQVYTRAHSIIEEEEEEEQNDSSELGYYCRACLESLASLWEARQHVGLQTHKDAMRAYIDMTDDSSSSSDDDDPYGPRGRSPERSESRGSIMSEIPTSSRPSRPSFPPPASYSSFGTTSTNRVSLTPRQHSSRPSSARVRLTPASRSEASMSSMSSNFASFGGVDTPPTSRLSSQSITDAHYRQLSGPPSPPSYRFLGAVHTDRTIGRTPDEFLASRRGLTPNSSDSRRDFCQSWRYGDDEERPWRAQKRLRECDEEKAVILKAKIPRETPVYDAEVYLGQPGEKYGGEWCEDAGCWLTEVQPICVVVGGTVIEEQPDEEIVILDTSIRCEICKLYVDTHDASEEEVIRIKYDHQSNPAHLVRREKMRKRFGICEAFNREIDKVKAHRIKLGLTANGRPRQTGLKDVWFHFSEEGTSFVRFPLSVQSNLEYHDWCFEVGQDPRLYYNSGWHFPVKEERKEEGKVLPKSDEMKLEDISYLTKGDTAGANYCCRCNVTLTSPWEIQKHLRTKTHRERSAVGQQVDERPPLIELEADILFTKQPTEKEGETETTEKEGETETTEVKIEEEAKCDPLSNEEREIAEVWGDEENSGGCPASAAVEFDRMVAAIINGESIEQSF
ncbi:hypothetical protein FOL47_009439 [Perkinsus chesapeaki]|uniref:C2H2-type domain-containing protein n=1 Tax=Perkinsus chesapeaki TaxID=330153 RepID=A0A7J6L870_PERCH|nr:hypothetical protein FOL47_009439 [Perkinsus chesapeaki]